MMNWIIGCMLLLSVVTGAFSGLMAEVSRAAMTGCGSAVELCIELCGALCLWSGVMKVADAAGLTAALRRLYRPVTSLLFRGVPQDSPAMSAMTMNMAANMLGLGNAATPLGLEAMRELQKLNTRTEEASGAMITFVVLNTASIQIIPATTAFLRLQAGSQAPMEILPAVWLSSAATVVTALTADAALRGFTDIRNRRRSG